MAILLFLIHISLFLLLLHFLSAKKIISLPPRWTFPAFLFKVIMGCLYGYIFLQNYGGDDTWMYHHQSLEETAFLKSQPLNFLESIIDPTKYTRYSMNTHWQELEYASLIKLLAVMNLFTGGFYYGNVVLFSMISFWGAYCLFRLFDQRSPGNSTMLILVFFFFVPMVFWTSGIRKDGLILLFTAMVFYYFQALMVHWRPRYMLIALVALFLLSLQRSVVALSLVPILVAWFITVKLSVKPWLLFLLFFACSAILFFMSPLLGVDLPAMIVRRQAEFLSLTGGSYVRLDPLEPNLFSFLKVLPQAINHSLFRPYPGEHAGFLYLGSSIETWLVIAMFLLCLFFRNKKARPFSDPCMLAVTAFIILNYLIIGYTIPFIGAIVRYRIVAELMLLAMLVLNTDWSRIRRLIYR